MRSIGSGLLAATIAAVALRPTGAQAQADSKFAFTPYVGLFSPSSDIFRFNRINGGTTVSFNLRQQTAVAAGASLSYWRTNRFGVEVSGQYAHSKVKGNLLMNQVGAITVAKTVDEADVWAATAKLMMQLLPPKSGLILNAGVGPAFVTRWGPAWGVTSTGRMTGLSNLGGAMSLCSRIPLASSVGLRLRAEDIIYAARQSWVTSAGLAGLKSDRRLQHDFVLSAGLQLSLDR